MTDAEKLALDAQDAIMRGNRTQIVETIKKVDATGQIWLSSNLRHMVREWCPQDVYDALPQLPEE